VDVGSYFEPDYKQNRIFDFNLKEQHFIFV
jgi:hypothetical protein